MRFAMDFAWDFIGFHGFRAFLCIQHSHVVEHTLEEQKARHDGRGLLFRVYLYPASSVALRKSACGATDIRAHELTRMHAHTPNTLRTCMEQNTKSKRAQCVQYTTTHTWHLWLHHEWSCRAIGSWSVCCTTCECCLHRNARNPWNPMKSHVKSIAKRMKSWNPLWF